MTRPLSTAAAVLGLVLAVPGVAPAAILTVDPARSCYRETQTVFLQGSGFTPNALVDVSREGRSLGRLSADASGAFVGELALPGLLRGQERLTYLARDESNPALTAEATVVASATDVVVRPRNGAPNRRLRIRGRGFFRGRAVWAHVVRMGRGPRARPVRTVRIGRVRGACRKVRARRRLLRARTRPGRYRVQFDTFRRYRRNRAVEYDDLVVRVFRTSR
ncbi:MAG: hypothetical protein ACRDL4_02430 [Thermoleophilaceae bacterium]